MHMSGHVRGVRGVRGIRGVRGFLVEVWMQLRPISVIQKVKCSAWRRYALYRVPFSLARPLPETSGL